MKTVVISAKIEMDFNVHIEFFDKWYPKNPFTTWNSGYNARFISEQISDGYVEGEIYVNDEKGLAHRGYWKIVKGDE